jgi:two-component system response regulator (stage 0 sporulation protein A)
MNNLEKAVNLLTDFVLADNDQDRSRIKEELRRVSYLDKPECPESTPRKVSRHLDTLGIPCKLCGYDYIITAVCALVERPQWRRAITKELYPYVAKIHDSTPHRVERSIRHAIEVGCDRCSYETFVEYFQGTVSPCKGKPTNAEFLSRLAVEINREGGEHEMDKLR